MGKCSDDEKRIIEDWFSSIDLNEENLTADQLFSARQQMLKGINSRIDGKAKEHKVSGVVANKYFDFKQVYKYAAVTILGLLVLTVTLYKWEQPSVRDANLESSSGASEILLSDGSKILLKNDSHLEYPEVFPDSIREVHLTGEAFFDIARDTERPFIIRTSSLVTKVLGTSFIIRAYENEDSKEVEVVTGKVLVAVDQGEGELKEVVLEPTQKIIYNKKENSITEISKVRETVQHFPQNEEMKFVEASLENIVIALSKRHNVTIELKNENLKNCRITADLSEEPLDVCLEIITKSINASHLINENKIMIDGNGCNY